MALDTVQIAKAFAPIATQSGLKKEGKSLWTERSHDCIGFVEVARDLYAPQWTFGFGAVFLPLRENNSAARKLRPFEADIYGSYSVFDSNIGLWVMPCLSEEVIEQGARDSGSDLLLQYRDVELFVREVGADVIQQVKRFLDRKTLKEDLERGIVNSSCVNYRLYKYFGIG
jgi:hypothetical protein